MTPGEGWRPAVRFKTSWVPVCLLLRGHRPTWGADQHALLRWRDAVASWVAQHPAAAVDTPWIRIRPGERLTEVGEGELDVILGWARTSRDDLPAIAEQARALFPAVWDRSWLPGHERMSVRDLAAHAAGLEP